jgi:hypothetical protein
MVHDRQGLPFGLETGDDLSGVHPRLEDFQGHLAAHGLRLLGHEHHAEASFPDLFQQLIGSDGGARAVVFFRKIDGGDRRRDRGAHKASHLRVRADKRIDALPEHPVVAAGLVEIP